MVVVRNEPDTITVGQDGGVGEQSLVLPDDVTRLQVVAIKAVEARNDADAMVFQTEKALEEVGDKVDATQKAEVEADLAHLKDLIAKTNPEVMSDGEVDDIKAAKEKLMNSAQQLFTKMYEQMQQQQGAQGAGPDMSGFQQQSGGNNDDNVVDGDYREV